MRVNHDGDIYIGLLLGRPGVSRFLSRRIEAVVTVRYADALEEIGDDLPTSSRITFHPDGRINVGNHVGYGNPLTDLRGPRSSV
jgi:hypothetical protein